MAAEVHIRQPTSRICPIPCLPSGAGGGNPEDTIREDSLATGASLRSREHLNSFNYQLNQIVFCGFANQKGDFKALSFKIPCIAKMPSNVFFGVWWYSVTCLHVGSCLKGLTWLCRGNKGISTLWRMPWALWWFFKPHFLRLKDVLQSFFFRHC